MPHPALESSLQLQLSPLQEVESLKLTPVPGELVPQRPTGSTSLRAALPPPGMTFQTTTLPVEERLRLSLPKEGRTSPVLRGQVASATQGTSVSLLSALTGAGSCEPPVPPPCPHRASSLCSKVEDGPKVPPLLLRHRGHSWSRSPLGVKHRAHITEFPLLRGTGLVYFLIATLLPGLLSLSEKLLLCVLCTVPCPEPLVLCKIMLHALFCSLLL